LLATIALAVTTTFLINMGKQKYAWITAVPMCFVGVTTLTAGVLSIKNIFWPLTSKPGQVFTGYLDSVLMSIFIAGRDSRGMRCGATLDQDAERRTRAAGVLRSSADRCRRSEDGLLLARTCDDRRYVTAITSRGEPRRICEGG
jgi:hypothetical protein